MVNFEEFNWDILSSINILFLKSADVHWSSKADHFVYHCVCFICVFTFFFIPYILIFIQYCLFFHLKDVCSQQGYVLKKGKEWYTYFWNPIFCSLRKCRAEKFKKPSILSDIVRIFLLQFLLVLNFLIHKIIKW